MSDPCSTPHELLYRSKADVAGTHTLDAGAHVPIPREVEREKNGSPTEDEKF